jgi:hypothetical protein
MATSREQTKQEQQLPPPDGDFYGIVDSEPGGPEPSESGARLYGGEGRLDHTITG